MDYEQFKDAVKRRYPTAHFTSGPSVEDPSKTEITVIVEGIGKVRSKPKDGFDSETYKRFASQACDKLFFMKQGQTDKEERDRQKFFKGEL